MGCDAHIHIEMKFDGVWHHYSHVRPARNYAVFAKICGVRARDNFDEDPLTKPVRAIPEDATLITRKNFEWQYDAHSICVLNLEQVGELSQWYFLNRKKVGERCFGFEYEFLNQTYLFGDRWDGTESLEEYRIEDVRFILWFDN